MKLYGYWKSSCSYRVRIALHYKNIPFEYIPVHLVKDGGEQNQEAFREKYPMAQVPLLEVPDTSAPSGARRIGQSLAILEWLEETYPEMPLLPTNPFERAQARQLAEIINAGVQPFQNVSVLRLVKNDLGGDDHAFARRFIEKGLNAYEALVVDSAGKASIGDLPSLADLCLVPQLIGARRFNIDLATLPTISRIEAHCMSLPAFQAAHPDKQIDAVIQS